MSQIKRAANPFRVHIPPALIPALRCLRDRQRPWSALIEAEDVVHLYYGLGPACFLTFDGRILVDPGAWDETDPYEVSEAREAWVALVVGADTFGCHELLQLLPVRPDGTPLCPQCRGSGWVSWLDVEGKEGRMVCWNNCAGLGWIAGDQTVE